jgi:ribosomal protein L12E/L44/L45/RPP1/RPP2
VVRARHHMPANGAAACRAERRQRGYKRDPESEEEEEEEEEEQRLDVDEMDRWRRDGDGRTGTFQASVP